MFTFIYILPPFNSVKTGTGMENFHKAIRLESIETRQNIKINLKFNFPVKDVLFKLI